MESPYYEMTHDFEEENRLFQSGYAKGYHDAVMRCPDIVRCKDCKFLSSPPGGVMFCEHIHKFVDAEWFCADGKRRDDDA